MPDTPKTFGQHLKGWLDAERMSQNELARRLDKSATYVNYLVRDINPSAQGQKAIQLTREMADKIADILNVPPGVVREAAGLASGDREHQVDGDVERLLRFYSDLPTECQKDVLALTEALWRRRRAEGRAEKRKLTRVSDLPAVAEFPDHTQQQTPAHTPRKKRRA